MTLLSLICAGALVQQAPEVDPLMLKIGRPGVASVKVDQVVDLRSGREATVEEVAKAADTVQWVFLGESHNNPRHHEMQAKVIQALVERGRNVTVGFEMFTRPVQGALNPWTLGKYTEAEFIEKSDWKKQWGFDYSLYKPIFEIVRKNRLPMVALNVPREWVREVGRKGYEGLTADQRKELPATFDIGNDNHKAVFNALMGGHPMTGPQGENIYKAQVLWDEGMADTAIKYMAKQPVGKRVFVVVAGSGHVMYGQGINWRVKKHTGQDGITVMMADGKEETEVSRGIGDFIYLAEPGA